MLHVKRYQYSTGSEKVARPLLIPRYLTLAVHCTEATREPSVDSLSEPAPDFVVDDDSESNSPPPEPLSASAAISALSASVSATSSRNNEHHFGKVIVPAQLQTGTSTTSTASTASGGHSRMPSSSSGHPSPHSRTGVKPYGMMPIEFDRANAAAFTTTTTTTTASCAGVRPTACINGTASTAMSNGSSGNSSRAAAPSSASSTCSKTGENLLDDPAAEEAVYLTRYILIPTCSSSVE